MSREDIRSKLRQIICDQLGVREDFGDDAEFVRDLGVDRTPNVMSDNRYSVNYGQEPGKCG